jgi:hypothetical protein
MTELPHHLPVVMGPVELPAGIAEGHHADLASVWHTPESFVLDFLAIKAPPTTVEDEVGQPVSVIETVVSTRVRMAPTHVFNLMQALNQELNRWEQETGHSPVPPSEA